jgi:hypothetical protein
MWGSRPLPEFMGEPDPINGGYGRYSRFIAAISDRRVAVRDNRNGVQVLRLRRRANASHWNENLSYPEMAQLIERFLEGNELYPQEWNDFVEVPQRQKERDAYRKRCYDLDPLVNSHEAADPDAIRGTSFDGRDSAREGQ